MRIKRNIIFLTTCMASVAVQAQLPTFRTVPNEGDAYSIIRHDNTDVEFLSAVNATEKRDYLVSITKKEGRKDAMFVCYCDQFRELKQFNAELYDGKGNLIRKFKKADLERSEYFEGLASDDYSYYLEVPQNVSVPFSIRYTWEIRHKDGLVALPGFYPQTSFNQAVDTASYKLTVNNLEDVKYKVINSQIIPTESSNKKSKCYTFSIGSLAPIKKETFGISLFEQVPYVWITPIEFSMEGKSGNMKSWESFGDWQFSLLDQRDELNDKAKCKVKEIIADKSDDKEKVKILYDYLGKNTRYVSIQLGIGGLQPFKAMDVFTSGFSDCKGLTNYMKAMLKEAGIPSTYTVISTKRADLLPDFASANQMNHVILQVPLSKDTLWLECTNPNIPFGYVHSDIAGHDALLITPEGGKIHRLPQYADSLNVESYHVSINLQEDGNAQAKITRESRLVQHEMQSHLIKQTEVSQKESLRRNIKLPNAAVTSVNILELKEAHPVMTTTYEAEMGFATKSKNRLFVPVNAFRKGFPKLDTRNPRKQPIVLDFGYTDKDSIIIQLPDSYVIESLPKNINIKSDFGNFSTDIKLKDRKLIINQSLHVRKGRYPVEKYNEFCIFTDFVSKGYGSKVILKKDL